MMVRHDKASGLLSTIGEGPATNTADARREANAVK